MNQPPRPPDGPRPHQPGGWQGPHQPAPGQPPPYPGQPARPGYGPGGPAGPHRPSDSGEHAGPSFLPPTASSGPSGPPPGGSPYGGGPYGEPPQQPSGGGNKALVVTLTVVLALVLLGGSALGGWYFFGRTDDANQAGQGDGGRDGRTGDAAGRQNTEPPEANLTGQVVWQHDWPQPTSINTVTVGAWTLDDAVVVGRPDELAAYDLDDGQQVWKFALPKDRYVCGMSRNTASDTGAVALSKEGELLGRKQAVCDEILLIDTASGETRSTVPLPDMPVSGSPVMEMTESALVFGDYKRYTVPLEGGRPTLFGENVGTDRTCRLKDVRAAGRDSVLAVTVCGFGAGNPVTVTALSPSTGQTQWTSQPIQLTSSEYELEVVSIDPIIVRTDGRPGRLFNLDDRGRIMSEIQATQDFGELTFEASRSSGSVRHPAVEADSMDASTDRGVLATEDTVYARTESRSGRDSAAIVAAFDRATGKPRWKQAIIGESELLFAGADESGVVMLSKGSGPDYDGTGGQPPKVYHLAAEGGNQRPLGKPYGDLMPPDSLAFDWMNVHATWTGKAVVVVDLGHDESDKDPRFVYALR